MSHKLIIKEIKSKKFQPVYFLHGEEPYFIDAICEAVINKCLQEEEKGFNQIIIYGKSAEPKMLINELKSFPMMGSEHRLPAKEAQYFSKLEELCPYLENPIHPPYLLCVINTKNTIKEKASNLARKMGLSLFTKS